MTDTPIFSLDQMHMSAKLSHVLETTETVTTGITSQVSSKSEALNFSNPSPAVISKALK